MNYGENNIYVENEGNGKGYCFDMIFKNCQNLNVKNSEIEFNSFDSNGTKDRKKLTILNYNLLSIEVNSIEININKEIEQIPSSDFYQFSINLEDNKIIVQPRETIEKPDLHKIMSKKKILNQFYEDLVELFKNKYNYKEQYYLILNSIKNRIKYINFNLNIPETYLEDYFRDNCIELDIIHKYLIFDICIDGKSKYSKDKELFQKTVEMIDSFYNKINKEEKIKIYEKIMLLIKISWVLLYCKDIESLNKINVKYYLLSECENNSIIDKAKKISKILFLNYQKKVKYFHIY